VQINVFNEHRETDFSEWIEKFDTTVRVELDDVNECFDMLKHLVMDSPAEPYFLSILQHLLFIRDDHLIRYVESRSTKMGRVSRNENGALRGDIL